MTDELSTLKAALEMYQSQYTATDRLWSYFSAVSLAVVAYTISSEKVKRIFPEATAVIAGYLVFCVGNFQALSAGQAQLITLASLVRERGVKAGVDTSSFAPFSVPELQHYYIAVITSISLATLVLAWYRGRAAKKEKPAG
jgi:hypothetical protein